MLAVYPEEQLVEGDVLITNDPWLGTGHLPDINVVLPVFLEGRMVGFAATVAHSPDIGGRIRSPDAKELYEEGLRIPVTKLLRGGMLNQDLVEIISNNVRVPVLVMGDIWAQVSANRRAAASLKGVIRTYAIEDVDALAATIQARSEAAMRRAIAELPDGTYSAHVQGDGYETPIDIHVKVTIEGDHIAVDYEGSSPQIKRALNVVPNYTFAYTVYPLKCAISPAIPNNEGCFNPITVSAPSGSILNPFFPAAVGARALTGHLLPPAIFKALSDIMPASVQAASGSPIWGVHMAGEEKGRRYASVFFFNGGQGASEDAPGYPCLSFPSNIAATPVEVIERNFPVRVLEKSVRRGSGGKGRQPGGDGQRLVLEHVGENAADISFMAERIRVPAFGLFGGEPGALGSVRINDREIDPKERFVLRPGDILVCETPGGGGFGNQP